MIGSQVYATGRPLAGYRCELIGQKMATSATANRLANEFRRCGFTMAQAIACISRTQRGMEIVILLAGGDKSTQSKDIKTALELARGKRPAAPSMLSV